MDILDGVASVAIHGRRLVDLTQVTSSTWHVRMLALQRKPGLAVIVGSRFPPVFDRVAAPAILAEISLVGLIGVMAAKTAGRRLRPRLSLGMTVRATKVEMSATEHKVRDCVIECGGIELHDDGIASLVVVMAEIAFGTLHERTLAVETGPLGQVCFHGLMTIKAKQILGRLGERRVARLALALDVRMRLDDRSRHKQSLKRISGISRPSTRQAERQGEQNEEETQCPVDIQRGISRDARPRRARCQ